MSTKNKWFVKEENSFQNIAKYHVIFHFTFGCKLQVRFPIANLRMQSKYGTYHTSHHGYTSFRRRVWGVPRRIALINVRCYEKVLP